MGPEISYTGDYYYQTKDGHYQRISNTLRFDLFAAPGPFEIKRVIFNDPATIVFWKDGTKTVVKCQDGEPFDLEKGLALCFMKKSLGNTGNYNTILKHYANEYWKSNQEK